MNTIQEKWDAFYKLVFPAGTPPGQEQVMKEVFYAGAWAVLRIMTELPPEISEAAGAAILQGLHDECRRFARETTNAEPR